MPPNTLRIHTEYVLVKSVGPKVLWAESQVQRTVEYFPPLQFHAKIVEVEIGGVAIYRPFGEFRRANSYCHLECWTRCHLRHMTEVQNYEIRRVSKSFLRQTMRAIDDGPRNFELWSSDEDDT
ncbi:uncharacterized protein TNCV_1919211 [Trichonephila clavipes]|nr:uncharacterized protein TNCV_1919211 [Trichonephila clavipes]